MVTPTPPLDQQSCSNCVAARASADGSIACHAVPPTVVIDRGVGIMPLSVWPPVAATDWCAQWQPMPASSAQEPQPIEDEAPAYAEADADIEDDDEPHAAPHKKKKRR